MGGKNREREGSEGHNHQEEVEKKGKGDAISEVLKSRGRSQSTRGGKRSKSDPMRKWPLKKTSVGCIRCSRM